MGLRSSLKRAAKPFKKAVSAVVNVSKAIIKPVVSVVKRVADVVTDLAISAIVTIQFKIIPWAMKVVDKVAAQISKIPVIGSFLGKAINGLGAGVLMVATITNVIFAISVSLVSGKLPDGFFEAATVQFLALTLDFFALLQHDVFQFVLIVISYMFPVVGLIVLGLVLAFGAIAYLSANRLKRRAEKWGQSDYETMYKLLRRSEHMFKGDMIDLYDAIRIGADPATWEPQEDHKQDINLVIIDPYEEWEKIFLEDARQKMDSHARLIHYSNVGYFLSHRLKVM